MDQVTRFYYTSLFGLERFSQTSTKPAYTINTHEQKRAYLPDEAINDELNVRVQILPLGLGRRAHDLDALLHHMISVLILHALHHLPTHTKNKKQSVHVVVRNGDEE